MRPLVQFQRVQAVICRIGWRFMKMKELQSCPPHPTSQGKHPERSMLGLQESLRGSGGPQH